MSDSTWDTSAVSAIIEQLQSQPGALLPILHGIQDELGYIPSQSLPLIAEALNLSRAEVHGVVSFYHYFRSHPPGQYVMQICRAESCQSMGSRKLEAHAKRQLNVDYHETTADGRITLEPVYCLGNCACSPSVRVGDDIYGAMDEAKFDALLDELATDVLEVK